MNGDYVQIKYVSTNIPNKKKGEQKWQTQKLAI